MRWRPLLGLGAAMLLMSLAGCGGGQGDALRTPAGGWGAPNADLRNTRSVRGPIDAASVSRLRVAWTVPLEGLYATTPVILDGVAYTEDMQANVLAIDVASGRVLWKKAKRLGAGPNGVSVVGTRLFGTTTNGPFALDARTGRQLWSTKLIRSKSEFVVMTPGYQDGTLYVSTNPGSAGGVGTLWALDAATGKRKWKWEEVSSELWGDKKLNGGGGLWHPPAFDEHGGLYIDIANPIPFPGVPGAPWGASRPGPNRWNNSIVKLDARTGAFLWGYQAVPHDVYDWDLECPVILARAGGRLVALAAGKMGFVFAFDAGTGALLWKRSVGIHNGHDHDNLLAMRGDYARLKLNQRLYPGGWGGVETQMASDGTTVYVPVNNLYAIYRAQAFAEPTQQKPIAGTGEVVAIDIATGRVEWDRKLPHGVYGAATVSNDLVFTTTFEGRLWALDKGSGDVVWRRRLPAGTDAPVAIAGDVLLTAASIALNEHQHPRIIAFRLGDETAGRR